MSVLSVRHQIVELKFDIGQSTGVERYVNIILKFTWSKCNAMSLLELPNNSSSRVGKSLKSRL